MTPKEKAEELFNKFCLYIPKDQYKTREIKDYFIYSINQLTIDKNHKNISEIEFWIKVKEEIQKL